MVNTLDELHEQPIAFLSRAIMRDQLAVDGVLRGLRVASYCNRDLVLRVGTQIVANQLHSVRSKNGVPKFPAPLFDSRRKQTGDRNAFANPLWHIHAPT